LKEYGVKINPAKCVLGKEKIKFLGYRDTAATGKGRNHQKLSQTNDDPTTATVLRDVKFLQEIHPGSSKRTSLT